MLHSGFSFTCELELTSASLVTAAASADATKHRSLLSHRLPLEAQPHPTLQLTPLGLVAAAGATTGQQLAASGSSAALQTLEPQHPPTQQQLAGLRADLLQVLIGAMLSAGGVDCVLPINCHCH